MENNNETSYQAAGPIRQFAAMFYDAWLLAAVFMLASVLTLPFTGGQPVEPGNPIMTTYIFFVWFGFYAWFWTHGGQTLGMRSWKIKLISETQAPIGLWQALLRFLSGMPAWLLVAIGSYLLFSDAPNLQHPVINALSKLPHGVVLGVASILLVSGHLKHSWREKFSTTYVVLLNKT